MQHEISEQITRLMMEYQNKLNASTLLVQETCSDEEFQRYRRAVGRATDFMFSEITKALRGGAGPADLADDDEEPVSDGETVRMTRPPMESPM
jgi:hypothetical protein